MCCLLKGGKLFLYIYTGFFRLQATTFTEILSQCLPIVQFILQAILEVTPNIRGVFNIVHMQAAHIVH